MNESDKIEFKQEYGIDNYLIINKYALWNVDPFILFDLDHDVTNYCMKKNLNNSKTYHYYTDVLGLENWGKKKISRFRKGYLLFNNF